jgi:hypothetical protein
MDSAIQFEKEPGVAQRESNRDAATGERGQLHRFTALIWRAA